MSSRRQVTIAGSLLTAALSTAMILPFAAVADDGPGPGSSEGGKAMDTAPAGVELTTILPKKISVDNATGRTSDLVATVSNGGSKGSGRINLLVVGFDGMKITDVPGCSAVGKADLPKGSNSAFNCGINNLAAGKTQSYRVSATFDIKKTGKICLPVQSGDGKKTYWQQGPVPFGTTQPSPNAPVTPLLLNTVNTPATPAGDQGSGAGSGSGSGGKELPRTGVGDRVLPLGLTGAALLAVGGAGLWVTRREPTEETN